MSEEDRKLQKHLVDEMIKVSKTNPDVMFYMEALMKKYEELEQKVEQLEKENKILKENAEHNDKVVDKVNWENMLLKEKNNQLENIRKEAIEYINKNKIIDRVITSSGFKETIKIYELNCNADELLNILNKGSDKE